jgi:hypothetical protein
MRIERAGLRLQAGRDFEIVDPEDDPRFRSYWENYAQLMGREGVTPEAAKAAVRRSNTLIAALMVKRGEADGLLCGLVGRYDHHLDHVRSVIGHKPGTRTLALVSTGYSHLGLDPLQWTLHCHKERCSKWQTSNGGIRRSSGARWSSWSGPGVNSPIWRRSLAARGGRSGSGSNRLSETQVEETAA